MNREIEKGRDATPTPTPELAPGPRRGTTGQRDFDIGPLEARDRRKLAQWLTLRRGSPLVVSRGRVHSAETLVGLVAHRQHRMVGLLTCHIEEGDFEVVTLDSLDEGRGIGSALLAAARGAARAAGCRRLWLITTNDNTPAIRFYERRGFRVVAVHVGAVTAARQVKPEIPLLGVGGVPIEDEVEMESRLDDHEAGGPAA